MKRLRLAPWTTAASAAILLPLLQPVTAFSQTSTKSPTRPYADSKLVSNDRISVEIVGKGPDVVLILSMAF